MRGFEFLAQPGFSSLSLSQPSTLGAMTRTPLEGNEKEPSQTALRKKKKINWLMKANSQERASGMAGSRSLSHVICSPSSIFGSIPEFSGSLSKWLMGAASPKPSMCLQILIPEKDKGTQSLRDGADWFDLSHLGPTLNQSVNRLVNS